MCALMWCFVYLGTNRTSPSTPTFRRKEMRGEGGGDRLYGAFAAQLGVARWADDMGIERRNRVDT